MAASAEADGSTTTPPVLVRMKKPLPRAIQLVMAIVWSGSESSTTTTASAKTIGELPGHRYRLLLWILPCMFIIAAACMAFLILCDDTKVGGRKLISGAGGFCFLAIPVLLFGYMAVLTAAGAHLALVAPRTPVAAWEALYKGTFYEVMGFIFTLTSILVWLLRFIDQAWPLLVAWTYLLGLLVASVVAFWLCLLRTYGDGGGERREKNSCGEAVIDGIAYLYCRLLYEYAARFHPGPVADAGMQHDADVAVVY